MPMRRLALLLLAALPLAAAEPRPLTLRPGLPLLLVDDTALASSAGASRTLHPARTHPAPVVVADQAWEGERVYLYGTVLRDPASGDFRMWYMSRGARTADLARAPTLRNNGYDLILYATSHDGLRWEKPALSLHSYQRSAANNIVYDLHSPTVLLDPFDRDPARRYKLLGYYRGAYHTATSPDGLHWTAEPDPSITKPMGDTVRLAQDAATGEFLLYHKRPDPRGRNVWLTRSPDFKTWSEPECVLTADEFDNAWATAPQRTEIYDMSVFSHAGGFIGFPAVFRVQRQRPKTEIVAEQSGHDGPIDIQLATSADGRDWKRTTPRLAIIPRGAPGTFDGGALLGVASVPVDTATETWVYYTAITTGHGALVPIKRLTIGRADWRLHGFASLDGGPDGARIETRPLRLAASTLVVNADAARGALRVALLEADGTPIAGYAATDCVALQADNTQAAIRWKSSAAVPTDRLVRIAVEFTSTRLFSLGVK